MWQFNIGSQHDDTDYCNGSDVVLKGRPPVMAYFFFFNILDCMISVASDFHGQDWIQLFQISFLWFRW